MLKQWVATYGIHIGQPVSIDEMDISFQGLHNDKQRVTYKKGGDGFLVDDLCAEGYTYLWQFINQLAPRKWIGYGLSPLHGQVMSLFEQIREKQVIIFVEWIIYLTRHSL